MLVTSIVCRAHKAAGLALDRLYIHAGVALVFVLQADNADFAWLNRNQARCRRAAQ
jgi:hypothetical protein